MLCWINPETWGNVLLGNVKKKKKSHSVLEIKNTEQQIIFMTSGESTDNQKQQTNEKDRSLLDLYLYVKLSWAQVWRVYFGPK